MAVDGTLRTMTRASAARRAGRTRRVAWIALAALALSLAGAQSASAQYREFSGMIQKISKKKMIVDNRQGDKVTFHRLKGSEVEDTSGGEKPKKKWTDLKSGDWVAVQWKMIDKPRKAYKVIVLPPKKEAGEDL